MIKESYQKYLFTYKLVLSQCIRSFHQMSHRPDRTDIQLTVQNNDIGIFTTLQRTLAIVYSHQAGESVFLEDDMTVEVIADGRHLPSTILRLVYKLKGVERTCLTTDALAYAANEGKPVDDPRIIIEDGVCKLADHSSLVGSIASHQAGRRFRSHANSVCQRNSGILGHRTNQYIHCSDTTYQ